MEGDMQIVSLDPVMVAIAETKAAIADVKAEMLGLPVAGTVTNNAGDVAAVSSHSGGAGTIHVVPATGYTDGVDDASVITDAQFLAVNIKHAIEIFGLTGSYDTEAVAPIAAATVLDGKKGFVNGALVTGTMPNNADADVEVVDLDGTAIPAGAYNGSGVAILAAAEVAKVIAGNIKAGVTLLGVLGTLPFEDGTADAIAADITLGKIAYVNGVKVVGTRA